MTSFLEGAVQTLAQMLEPLRYYFQDVASVQRMLERYGWKVSIADAAFETVKETFAIDGLEAALELSDQLRSGQGSLSTVIENSREALGAVIEKLWSNADDLPQNVPPPFNQAAFWEDISLALVDDLLISYLEREQPLVYGVLRLLTVILVEEANPAGAQRIPYTKRRVAWDQLIPLITDPAKRLREFYQWGGSDFEHQRLLDGLEALFLALWFPVRQLPPRSNYYPLTDPRRNRVRELSLPLVSGAPEDNSGYIEFGLRLLPIAPDGDMGNPQGLLLTPIVIGRFSTEIDLGNSFFLGFSGGLEVDDALGIKILPSGIGLLATANADSLDAGITLSARPPKPWVLLGDSEGSRLQMNGAFIGLRVRRTGAENEFIFSMGTSEDPATSRLELILQFGNGDNFLQKIFGSEEQRMAFGFALTWSSATGLRFSSSAGLSFTIPINKTIAVVEITTLKISLQTVNDRAEIVVAVSGKAEIGPVAASVTDIGIKLTLTPKSSSDSSAGVLGNLDLGFGFKPPTGLGLRINAGPVTGGGFLELDQPNGRYAGILQLSIGTFGITVIGLLDTILPGGVRGYSFLLIIAVKFSPINLGFGFALTGLGGLAGIHRSMVQEALRDGVRNQSLDHIMFPDDPVKNAPRLINDLRAIFPPTHNVYLFGPLVRLIWGGATTIIEAELGVILQLPNPLLIVILGQFNVMLPSKDVEAKIIELHLDIVGIIDVTNSHLSLDASLHHSRIAIFNVEGDMAMRLSWGSPPNFLLSVGGFNTHFDPPPNMPELRRITFALATSDNPRLRLMAYFAITSNSVQFGARAELYASALGFTISGWLDFEAIFYFKPRFAFRIDIDAGVEVKLGGWVLFAVKLYGSLSGPSPYHIQGEAVFRVIFEIRFAVDRTFGEQAQDEEPAIKRVDDLWLELKKELEEPRNWTAVTPANTRPGVTIGIREEDRKLQIFDPLGGLIVRQRLLPLNRRITRFGEVTLDAPVRFGVNNPGSEVADYFAPAQFDHLSEQEKLTRPSFDRMQSGTTLAASTDVAFARTYGATFDYESWEIDAEPQAAPEPVTAFVALAELLERRGNGVGLAAFASDNPHPLVRLADEWYVVVSAGGALIPSTRDQAYEQAKANAVATNRPLQPVIPLTDWEA